MAYTYSKIGSVTVGSGGATDITFSNIPQNYTDLVLYTSLRDSASTESTNYYIRINGVRSTTYTRRNLYGTGATTGTTGSTDDIQYIGYSNSNTSTGGGHGSGITYFPNYTSSNPKATQSETVAETNTATNVSMAITTGYLANNTAIANITIGPWTAPFLQYSTATLYGIRVEL